MMPSLILVFCLRLSDIKVGAIEMVGQHVEILQQLRC